MVFKQYISDHSPQKITLGKSGADVYALNNGLIAKHIKRSMLNDDSLWETYFNEYRFYQAYSRRDDSCLPKIYYLNGSDDEIQIIMKQYKALDKTDFNDTLLKKILETLVDIHHLPRKLDVFREEKRLCLDDKKIENCLNGWHEVLLAHGDRFSFEKIKDIAENINILNEHFHHEKTAVCHGDFHFENLLTDDDGHIVVCDFQSVYLGHPAGDLAFFISRLAADGYPLNEEKVIQMYCDIADTDIRKEDIIIQMKLSNLNTSFAFWHMYLHQASAEKVGSVYEKMVKDMEYLFR